MTATINNPTDGIRILDQYILQSLRAELGHIDHGKQYILPSGLKCNVYLTGKVVFQATKPQTSINQQAIKNKIEEINRALTL